MTYVDFQSLQKFLHNSSEIANGKFIKIHEKKLIELNRGPIGQNYQELKSKLIHNISSYDLSPTEERILCRGWDFCIENKITNFIDFKTDIELNVFKIQEHCHPNVFTTLCRKLNNYSEIFIKSVKKKRIRNISDEEFNAIKSLKNNKNIIICRADKGNSIVILNKEDYINKINEILKQKQFKPSKQGIIKEKEKSMNKCILKLYNDKIIEKDTYWKIHSTCSSYATLYGQPKIHKANYPLRPIISSIGAYNHDLSKYLYYIIKNNRPSQSFSYIKDSYELVKKITGIHDSSNQIMISFDVDNLYTNVPVNEAIEVTLDMLFKRSNPAPIPFTREQFKELLEIAVCNVPFRFHDKIYIQNDGVAMGSPLGPVLADLFMTHLEQRLNKFSTNKPSIWIRYVDDVFCIFKKNQNIKDFLLRINKWHPNIKFTSELEFDEKLAFLDVLISRDNITHKYNTTIYRKPTNTNLYLLYESNQCRDYKLSLIRTLVIRIHRICSSNELKNQELNLMRKTLIMNGYPLHLIKRGIREGEIISKRIISQQKAQILQPKKILYFILSYYGQESTILAHRIKRLCKSSIPHLQINVCFRKTFTLKSIFLPLQKGLDESKKHKKLIYKITCSDCEKCYIGETNREKEIRIKEHKADIKKQAVSSHVAKHANEQKHSFDFSRSETLALETNWRRRIIKESLFTNLLKEKSLNDVKFKLNIFT
ncbi:unnamed protein product [Rotaria sp. Silwood2]|nr:unnamed protein product [Rotaria sp. Silwood2]CAF4375541.1 unnamed protein product [Rotaria sp. Silwood2]CAF4449224.1 unnamed protein product [Rotaria sp. Silwood2]